MIIVYLEKKRDATFHLRVLRYRFRPRSILSRNYKKRSEMENYGI
jgi:hypothetical protein